MLTLNKSSIVEFLNQRDLEATIQDETDQIYVKLAVEKREFPLFLRIYEDTGLLQLLVFLPCSLEKDKVAEMGRLLHMLNKEIDIPGFGMDEMAGVVFFRCIIPSHEKEIHGETLEAFLGTIQTISHSFSPAVEALAAGAVSFEEMLSKAQEMQDQAEGQATQEPS